MIRNKQVCPYCRVLVSEIGRHRRRKRCRALELIHNARDKNPLSKFKGKDKEKDKES